MYEICRVVSKQQVFILDDLLRDYTKCLGKEDENDELMVSIFTKIKNPGTLLLLALKKGEPVGFLWAQSVNQFNESYLRISELYAKEGMMGTKLFEGALEWAQENNFLIVKGLVSAERSKGMIKLFKAKVEAVLISVEVDHE